MRKFTLVLIVSIFSLQVFAQEEPCLLDQQPIQRLVIDQADILSPQEEQELEANLVNFSRETSNQILVVTVNDLCGYDKADFTYTLGEKWGVGKKGFDNGVVIMVKPHGSAGDRHTFIAVGYGLEGAIPDATAKRIVELELIPHFKQNDFFGGISSAVLTVEKLAIGEFNAKDYGQSNPPLFPIFIILGIIFFVFISFVNRARKHSLGKNVSFWTALWLLSQMNNKQNGGWNNFHSGSGNFGGGGSFGGGSFGGGSFGGGGAGGSW